MSDHDDDLLRATLAAVAPGTELRDGLERILRGNTGALVARAEIDYLAPLAFRPHGVVIDVWAGRIGGASFELDYLIRDPDDLGDTVYARAATTMVWYDARTGATRRATPQERAGLERMEGEPLALGRSARGAGGAR